MKLLRGVSRHSNGFRSTLPRYFMSTASDRTSAASNSRISVVATLIIPALLAENSLRKNLLCYTSISKLRPHPINADARRLGVSKIDHLLHHADRRRISHPLHERLGLRSWHSLDPS